MRRKERREGERGVGKGGDEEKRERREERGRIDLPHKPK
jgi:hypothetical protein